MMLIAVISLMSPGIFSSVFAPESTIIQEHYVNIGLAVVLLLLYGLYLVFMLRTHPDVFESEGGGEEESHGKSWSLPRAVGTLLGASVLAAWMSEILVGAAEGTGESLGMSQAFMGIVFLALVGGAAESGSAVAMARKNKVDLTMGIALGSSIQIALFVAPVLVLASYFIAPVPLQLDFGGPLSGILFLGVFIAVIVAGGGRSNWFKGAQLIAVYAIFALLFYFVPTR
jgi:Ca2+:H+ antiporter